ncbi:PEP-utilizing enzyme [Rhodococcus koreensis]|uniref:PEP-utilizing enzyme n=1 Tax=Rhodococcus koreensis TaxID=99653 RepID=UPI003671906C
MNTQLDHFDPVRGRTEANRYWTITNVSEATPDILSPLCWSVWGRGMNYSWVKSMYDFGVLKKKEVVVVVGDPDRCATGSFFGRQAVNVDLVRGVLSRLPGVNADDVERDLLGSARSDAPVVAGASLRAPIVLCKFPTEMMRLDRAVRRLYADQAAWWREHVYSVDSDQEFSAAAALQRLKAATSRFETAMTLHAKVRFLLPVAERPVHAAAGAAGVPDLAAPALQGWGNVAETTMAVKLWEVANGTMTLEDFLAEYGYHGPNEGNVYTKSWREQPERVASLVASYRGRSDLESPLNRESGATAAREAAERTLLAALPARKRPSVRFMLRRSAGLVRKLETGKASYLMALDGARCAARELGIALRKRGSIAGVDDVFFLTISELEEMIENNLPNVSTVVEYRRSEREKYATMQVPVTFTGMPEPVAETRWAAEENVLRGLASGGGRVQGRARVVLDASTDIELEDGDVLVCKFTDPSWTPLMTMADALVIDIGSHSSHGAVVARELAVPYVIGTDVGTRVIREGDLVAVDGAEGTVTILKSGRYIGDSSAPAEPTVAP